MVGCYLAARYNRPRTGREPDARGSVKPLIPLDYRVAKNHAISRGRTPRIDTRVEGAATADRPGSDKPGRWETKEEMRFDELTLAPVLVRNVTALGYDTPTPIQAQAIPAALEGRDVLGRAPTGTGKTAAFMLPTLHHLRGKEGLRALVLCPTRELAIQVAENARA